MVRGLLYGTDSHQSLSMSAYKYSPAIKACQRMRISTRRPSLFTELTVQQPSQSTMTNDFIVNCCVRGYHVYSSNWTPTVGEQLETFCEAGNRHDKYAVAVTKENSGEVIGHLPRNISCTCWYFIKSKGEITG